MKKSRETNVSKLLVFGGALLSAALTGCQPRTPAEKMKDGVEDAAHDAGQGIERAGEKVKDATN